MIKHCKISVLLFIFLNFFVLAKVYAIDAVDVLGGYFDADIDQKKFYRGYPVMIGLSYSDKNNKQVSYIVEPFFTTIAKTDKNIEVGSNLLLKYTTPQFGKVALYFKGGLGIMYMTAHTREQSTQVNFASQGGLGLNFFVTEKAALSFEHRFRHISNCSMGNINKGINAQISLIGLTYFFND